MQVVKVSEVSGAALDWLVAKVSQPVYSDTALVAAVRGGYDALGHFHEPFNPSAKWAHGGPIKEKHQISTTYCNGGVEAIFNGHYGQGSTELIAVMRCYVASKLGETVEVPDELFKSIN